MCQLLGLEWNHGRRILLAFPDAQRLWRHWLRLNALLPGVPHRELQSEAASRCRTTKSWSIHRRTRGAGCDRSGTGDELERSRLSHHVTRMAGRGLVERTECHDDGRGAWVVLTERGRSAIEQAAPGHAATVRGLIFDDLTPEELETMTAVVDRVLARLGEPGPS